MGNESGAEGIAHGITKTLTRKMWTGEVHGWVEIRTILLRAIQGQPGARACCVETTRQALGLPLDPSRYTYFEEK
jgi:hypothetical protein